MTPLNCWPCKALLEKALSHVMKPLGIQGTIGSLVQFMKDIPHEFILEVNLTIATDVFITLQSS